MNKIGSSANNDLPTYEEATRINPIDASGINQPTYIDLTEPGEPINDHNEPGPAQVEPEIETYSEESEEEDIDSSVATEPEIRRSSMDIEETPAGNSQPASKARRLKMPRIKCPNCNIGRCLGYIIPRRKPTPFVCIAVLSIVMFITIFIVAMVVPFTVKGLTNNVKQAKLLGCFIDSDRVTNLPVFSKAYSSRFPSNKPDSCNSFCVDGRYKYSGLFDR